MKKSLFYLFALICSASLFTACSDDDEDMGWKQIPSDIPSENVTLDLNGLTVPGATAQLEIKTAETGVLTLKNLLYNRESVEVNVNVKKVAEGSYDFDGKANLDGATKATATPDLGLTVTVTGNVTGEKKGDVTSSFYEDAKLKVNVTTSGWGTISNVYSGDSLVAKSNGFVVTTPITLTAISDSKVKVALPPMGTYNDIKYNDVVMEATYTADGTGYKLEGSHKATDGLMFSITGTISDKSVLTLDITKSGYETLSSTYYVSTALTLDYNGKVADKETSAASAVVKFTSSNTLDLTLCSIVPAVFILDEKKNDGIAIKNVKYEKDEATNTYTFSGSINPEGFKASTITYQGSLVGSAGNGKLKLSVTQTINSDIVGKWNMAKNANGLGKIFFDYQSAGNKVVIPDALYQLIPKDMQAQIPAQMDDNTFTQIITNLLGQYTIYLKSIEFKATGEVVVVYTKMGEEAAPKEYILEDYMNYAITDKGKLAIAPNLAKLMGMLMPTNTTLSSKAYDPYDATYILMGEGIPLNFQVNGSELKVTVDNGVFKGFTTLLEGPNGNDGLLMLIYMFMPDLKDQIEAIYTPISEFIKTSQKLEVGLYLNK